MFGHRASELLKEVAKPDSLPVYADEGVRQVLAETEALCKEVADTLAENPGGIKDHATAAGFVVHSTSISRNRRCLLAYHMARCERIEQLRWRHGGVIDADVRGKLSSSEADYFKAYSGLLTRYMEDIKLDLTADLGPPKSTHVLVRALQDGGIVVTSDGAVELKKGVTYKMFALDAERLIRRGQLEHVNDGS